MFIAYGASKEEYESLVTYVTERRIAWPFVLRIDKVGAAETYGLRLGTPSEWNEIQVQKEYDHYEFPRKAEHLKSFAEGWFAHVHSCLRK